MYHGLSAFYRSCNIYDLISRVKRLNSVVACYSDTPIGPIGVYCDIQHADYVEYISDRDVFSMISQQGCREIERTSASDDADIWYVNNDTDDLYALYCEYSRKAELVNKPTRYCEIAAKAHPAAIWVNKAFGAVWLKRANVLSKMFGLTLMVV